MQDSRLVRPAVVHFDFGVDLIVVENDLASRFFNTNADRLFSGVGRARIADNIVAENEVLGFAPHADSGGLGFGAVVFDQIVLKPIAMTGHAGAFVAKENAVLVV